MLTATYTYDAWGNILFESGIVTQPYRFTTRPFDPVSGFIDLRARAYVPGVGRFIQRDPLGLEPDINLYRYVSNDPINEIDPTGQWSIRIPDPTNIYGNYCGITNTGKGGTLPTKGCVDEACKKHDDCLASSGNFWKVGDPSVNTCHNNLCGDLAKCKPSSCPEYLVKLAIMATFSCGLR